MMDILGKGEFGIVKSAIHLKSEVPCAIKIISKDSLGTDKQKEFNKNQFEILEEISHPHITRVYELLHDD